jgi:glyoxylase-like metal-dependent hydrolase (beta-lactamase superfamily II)
MRVTTHGDYLVQLARWARIFPVNIYLVREQDSLTLIDTGISGKAHFVIERAQDMELPISRIVLTHSDPDHIGGLDQLRNKLPDAEVLMTEMSARVLSGELIIDKYGNQREPATSKPLVATRATGILNAGDTVGSLEVIAAPGHKPDQVAFLDTRDETLVAGDAFQTKGGIAVAGIIRWTFPFPGLATVDKATALQTAKRLRQLNPSRLATGHGDVLEEPVDAMDRAIAEAAGNVERGAQDAI